MNKAHYGCTLDHSGASELRASRCSSHVICTDEQQYNLFLAMSGTVFDARRSNESSLKTHP